MKNISGAYLKTYSSSIGRNIMHLCFKTKYCHKIFDDAQVRQRCAEILQETSERHDIAIREMGFDRDHVHLTLGAGPNYSPSSVSKILKGNSGWKLLQEFPRLKKQYFWGSGLWSPSYYFDSIGERTCSEMDGYVRNQGTPRRKIAKGQAKLTDFAS